MTREKPLAVPTTRQRRNSERRALALHGRLLWKDDSGAIRFTPVVTRNVSDYGVFVECEAPTSIPLFRLVHLQIERTSTSSDAMPDVPDAFRQGRILSAVYRLGRYRSSTGTPDGYALRLLVEPQTATTAAGELSARSIA